MLASRHSLLALCALGVSVLSSTPPAGPQRPPPRPQLDLRVFLACPARLYPKPTASQTRVRA